MKQEWGIRRKENDDLGEKGGRVDE